MGIQFGSHAFSFYYRLLSSAISRVGRSLDRRRDGNKRTGDKAKGLRFMVRLQHVAVCLDSKQNGNLKESWSMYLIRISVLL